VQKLLNVFVGRGFAIKVANLLPAFAFHHCYAGLPSWHMPSLSVPADALCSQHTLVTRPFRLC